MFLVRGFFCLKRCCAAFPQAGRYALYVREQNHEAEEGNGDWHAINVRYMKDSFDIPGTLTS
jgi:hypothetical protein